MDIHTIILDTNRRLMDGEVLSDPEIATVCDTLRRALQPAPHRSATSRRFAPEVLPPPVGEKFRLITGYLPKTFILSSNAYELEGLRLLSLFDGGNDIVNTALAHTRDRLAYTCFGKFCPQGECFEAGIAALRFLKVAFPDEREWAKQLGDGLRTHLADKTRSRSIVKYYEYAVN